MDCRTFMDQTLSRPAEILRELIRCPSVTPQEGGALAYLEKELSALGFTVERITFGDENTPDVENLYARFGDTAPHVMFAGHTDVVPPGNEQDWSHNPFSGDVAEDLMFGRGAVDMKGGIACFLAAVETFLSADEFRGSISFLITGDEEGPSINGTDKLLKWAAERGETWDAAIVGEPSNTEMIGDVIKNGRRGSLSGILTVTGSQGHSAYPHRAKNPVPALARLIDRLATHELDQGTPHFDPSSLAVTTFDTGNTATNVIPANCSAAINIRSNQLGSRQSGCH